MRPIYTEDFFPVLSLKKVYRVFLLQNLCLKSTFCSNCPISNYHTDVGKNMRSVALAIADE